MNLAGHEVNPLENMASLEVGSLLQNYLNHIFHRVVYQYRKGSNEVSAEIRPRGLSAFQRMLLAILSAIFVGVGIRFLFPAQVPYFAEQFVKPFFKTLLGILTAVVVPSVFLSLVTGIITVGDPKQLSKIGKRVIQVYLFGLGLVMAFMDLFAISRVPLSDSSSTRGAGMFAAFWQMLLKFIPVNLLDPFFTGNTMQVLVLAIIFGTIILYMREDMDDVVQLICSFDKLLRNLLQAICSCIPILIFVGIVKAVLGDFSGMAYQLAVIIGTYLEIFACLTVLLLLFLWFDWRRSPLPLLKKMLPPVLIGFFTASSTAALASSLSTCEEKLGVQGSLCSFAVPLGQIIIHFGTIMSNFIAIVLCMNFFGKPLNLSMLLILGFITYMLSMATPPISGGSLGTFTLLNAFMGLPEEALMLGLTSLIFLDFFMSAMNVFGVLNLVLAAGKRLHLIDEKVLFGKQS